MDEKERLQYETQSQTLRAELKNWENDWAKEHQGKKPARNDIKQNLDIGRRFFCLSRPRVHAGCFDLTIKLTFFVFSSFSLLNDKKPKNISPIIESGTFSLASFHPHPSHSLAPGNADPQTHQPPLRHPGSAPGQPKLP